jgi:hypothetical protein
MSPSFRRCLEAAARASELTRLWRRAWGAKQYLSLAPHLDYIRGALPPPLDWPLPGMPIIRIYYDKELDRERVAWWDMPPADVEADDWEWGVG